MVGQIEKQGPSFGVVAPHYLDGLPSDQICGVSALIGLINPDVKGFMKFTLALLSTEEFLLKS